MGKIRDKVRRLSNNSYLKLRSKKHLCWNNFSAHNFHAQYSVGALCGMTTTLFGSLFSLPRTMYAMANDGLLFGFLGHVNERTQVPVLNLAISGSVSALIALLFDLQHLVEFMSIGTFLAYTIVSASVIILRYRPEKTTPPPSNAGTPSSLTSPPTEGADSNSDCNSVASAESEVKEENKRNQTTRVRISFASLYFREYINVKNSHFNRYLQNYFISKIILKISEIFNPTQNFIVPILKLFFNVGAIEQRL